MIKRTDKQRMDFLADSTQMVANVHLLCDAIDRAMDEFEQMEKDNDI